MEKLQRFRPKIAVFNGKGIYEVFSGKKEFTFGKQPECIEGTNTVSGHYLMMLTFLLLMFVSIARMVTCLSFLFCLVHLGNAIV